MRRLLIFLLCSTLAFGEMNYFQVPTTGAGGGSPVIAAAVQIGIDRTGSCSAATTSCTLSATKTGDLKVVFAYNNGLTTIPTCPGTFTCPGGTWQGATGSTGTTGAFIVGCNVSSSSSDTSTGTWTNASGVTAISYSGTAAALTSNCNTTGVGAVVNNNAQASTTISITIPTLDSGIGTSWVAQFEGYSGTSSCAPQDSATFDSPQNITVAQTNPVMSMDSSGIVMSGVAMSCTITSSTWMIFGAEILKASCPSMQWCLVAYSVAQTRGSPCPQAPTCSLTLSQATGIGHVLIAWYGDNNADSPSIIGSGGGTWVASPAGCQNQFSACSYVLSSTSGTTSVTITITPTPTSTGDMFVAEYAPPSGKTASYDTSGNTTQTNCASCVGVSLTLAGSNELIVQYIAFPGHGTYVTLPYKDPQDSLTGNMFVGALSVSSGAAPTFTSDGSSGTSYIGAIAFNAH